MANQEQVDLLKQNIEEWNFWCYQHPDIKIVLSDADLSKMNLLGINLSGANLIKANLHQSILRYVPLYCVNLSSADLSDANLEGAKLENSKLIAAQLFRTNLTEANLNYTNLTNALLAEAQLKSAKLISSNCRNANFYSANLEKSNFENADLSYSSLKMTTALGTSFKGANLTGACIEDWNINSNTNFEGVVCDYIYLKWDVNKGGSTERRPSDPNRNFAPGEFTKLFQQARETVDLIFSEGIDWQAFLTSYQNVQLENNHGELDICAIKKSSDASFVISVEVPSGSDKAKIERIFFQKYKKILTAKTKEYRKILQSKAKKIQNQQEEIIKLHREKSTDLMKIIELQAQQTINIEAKAVSESYSSKYDQRNAQNQFVDTAQSGSTQNFTQNIEQKQDLRTAAREIQSLLEQLDKDYGNSKTILATEVIRAVDNNSKLKTLLTSLQAGSMAALEQFLNHPAASFVITFLDTWHQEQLNG